MSEEASTFADGRVHARQGVEVAREVAEQPGQSIDDVAIELHGIDVGCAGLERGEDVTTSTSAHDAHAAGFLELVADAGDIEEEVREIGGRRLEMRDGRSRRRVLL